MSTMGLLASLTLWMYISTTTALSVSGGLNVLIQPLIEQDLNIAQITAILHIIQGQPLPGEDDAQLDLQTCQENLQGLTSRLEFMQTENNNKDDAQLDLQTCQENQQGLTSRLEFMQTENNNKDAEISRLSQILEDERNCISDPVSADRNDGSDVLTELQKVQAVLQEIQAKDATINHTLITHEAELDIYKDEVATLTGIIQDQQSVIEGLQNFGNTLPDEVAILTGIIQDQQSVIEGLQHFSNTLPDEVATLTGKIQTQQRVIQGLQSFSNTLPDEVAILSGNIQAQNNEIQRLHTAQVQLQNTCSDEIDGLSERFNDQQNQTEWLKMKYDELENRSVSGNRCVGAFEIFEYHCYHFNHTLVTWSQARRVCNDHGGDLAVDNFNTLNNFYITKKQPYASWIGMRDNLWLNGQTPQQQQWYSGQPDAQNLCGWMHSGGLGDSPCHGTRRFICQLY